MCAENVLVTADTDTTSSMAAEAVFRYQHDIQVCHWSSAVLLSDWLVAAGGGLPELGPGAAAEAARQEQAGCDQAGGRGGGESEAGHGGHHQQ